MKQWYFERMELVDSFNDRLDDTLSEWWTSKTDAELGDLTSDVLQDPTQKPFDQLTPEEKIEKGKWLIKAIGYNHDQFKQAIANNPDGKSIDSVESEKSSSKSFYFIYKNYSVYINVDWSQPLPSWEKFYISLKNKQTKQEYILHTWISSTLVDWVILINVNAKKRILLNDATISEHLPLLQKFTDATYFMWQEQLKLNQKSSEKMKKF